MKQSPTARQQAYIRRLQYLVGDQGRPPSSWSEAQHRIRLLKQQAKDRGVPTYKFEPAPVKIYYDESVKLPPPGA